MKIDVIYLVSSLSQDATQGLFYVDCPYTYIWTKDKNCYWHWYYTNPTSLSVMKKVGIPNASHLNWGKQILCFDLGSKAEKWWKLMSNIKCWFWCLKILSSEKSPVSFFCYCLLCILISVLAKSHKLFALVYIQNVNPSIESLIQMPGYMILVFWIIIWK